MWPNRTGYSIPCAVMLGSGWGELGGGKAIAARERVAVVGGESSFVRSAVCVVVSPYWYHWCYCCLCLLFSLTALIPTHQFLPVSFYSPPHSSRGRGGRVAAWPFCCRTWPNYNSSLRVPTQM